MRAIKSSNTKPEIFIRSLIHRKGFRFRKHVKFLPGTPDIYLKKYNLVIQVNSCFYHGHDCYMFKWPKSNVEFWREKILSNQKRDRENLRKYKAMNLRTIIVWTCAISGKKKIQSENLSFELAKYIKNKEIKYAVISHI